jgi:hypothetical protein
MSDANAASESADSLCMSVILSEFEADLAYCDVRVSLIGSDPDTPYQRAQLKAFKVLEKQLKKGLSAQYKAIASMR